MSDAADNLARIKARAEEFHATAWQPGRVPYKVADALADDVLALVEIARAALEMREDDAQSITFALERALARLDTKEEA